MSVGENVRQELTEGGLGKRPGLAVELGAAMKHDERGDV